jgi:predicted metalloprotease
VIRRLLALLLAAVALGGCGEDDVRELSREAQERAQELAADARRARDRLERKVREVLRDLEQTVPAATSGEQAPRSRGRTGEDEVGRYLEEVLDDVDGYWTRTLTAAGRDEPRVGFLAIPEGRAARTGCGAVADELAAFYCPSDDTIYVGRRLAAELWAGINESFPGQRAGYGRAVGDFGLAYVLAHEYAHNVQHELGLFSLGPRTRSKPFELQADCMAGAWANSVYASGRIQEEDVQEAMSTALASGDFDYVNADHHGTPQERLAAWQLGYESGDPAQCSRFRPT